MVGPKVSQQRRTVDGDFVAEFADFLVGDDEDGFALAEFGFAGDEHGAVVHAGRVGVAGQGFEVGVAVALAVREPARGRTKTRKDPLRCTRPEL